jgi:hypothetical protein
MTISKELLDELLKGCERPEDLLGDAGLMKVDLSRFDAAPLIAFTATKETNYGTETDGRIPARRGADCTDQWADAQASG